ncbi:MAG: SPOR domain-containing protein [Gammaproteobacteria bacterium]|nr:MAG: SPOR domain-containing protein [Gammaproteobacteria bacterium]
MRNLFLLLLLLNLLLLGWQRWVLPPPVADPYAQPGGADVPALAAYRPAPGPARPAGRAEAAVAQGPDEPACIGIGPFSEAAAARRAAALLAARQMRVQIEARDAAVWLGHWVQLTGFRTREQAAAALRQLKAAGLSDAYIVRDGDAFLISLGVFRSDAGTERTIALARAAGFEPVARDRYRQGTERWLLVEYPPGSPPDLGELAAVAGGILRLETGGCREAADGRPAPNSIE